MDQDKGFGITTPVIPLMSKDGRMHFAYPKPISVRVLEWTVPTLWLLAPAVVVMTLI